MAKVLVLGVGNPWRGDDGVGPAVIASLQGTLDGVMLEEAGAPGLALVEMMLGLDRVVVVDALVDESGPPGRVGIKTPEDFPAARPAANPHGAGLLDAMAFGRRVVPADMPRRLALVTVTIGPPGTGEGLSPPVAAAVTEAADAVRRVLREWEKEDNA
jgi:hydrogenase maturation protease